MTYLNVKSALFFSCCLVLFFVLTINLKKDSNILNNNFFPKLHDYFPNDQTLNRNTFEQSLLKNSKWSKILNGSKAQQKIDSKIILETLRFMITETDENDPELIEFVKSLIRPPSSKGIKLNNPKRVDFSQFGESLRADKMLKGMRNGFMIEAGALDGELFSNSIFFERERNWSGILIEPLPLSYEKIIKKNRKMYSINACIAKKTPMVAKFRMYKSGAYSGRNKIFVEKKKIPSSFEYVYVPCFSLKTILSAIDVNKVDFFSLDVEGGEWDVLNSIDFDKMEINSFVIEFTKTSKEELIFKE